MTTITINGNTFSFEGDQVLVTSKNGSITAGGIVIASGQSSTVNLVIEGGVASVTADGSVTCGEINGDVEAGGSVNCHNVGGSVQAGGSVRAASVTGRISAGGSVRVGS